MWMQHATIDPSLTLVHVWKLNSFDFIHLLCTAGKTNNSTNRNWTIWVFHNYFLTPTHDDGVLLCQPWTHPNKPYYIILFCQLAGLWCQHFITIYIFVASYELQLTKISTYRRSNSETVHQIPHMLKYPVKQASDRHGSFLCISLPVSQEWTGINNTSCDPKFTVF